MNIDFTKGSHILFFGGILTFLSLLSAWCFSQIFPNPTFWVETLSPLVAYGVLYSLFDKYFWRWKIFEITGVVRFPDLNGRWKGNQRSSHKKNGVNVEIPSYLEITQSFSKIYVRAFYEKSQSESTVASFVNLNDQVYLYYTYDNDPNSLKIGTMQRHKGTVKLILSSKDNVLIGSYFNSIGNNGEMRFTLESKDKLNRFER